MVMGKERGVGVNESYKKIYEFHKIDSDEMLQQIMLRDGFKTEADCALWLSKVMGMKLAIQGMIPMVEELKDKLDRL